MSKTTTTTSTLSTAATEVTTEVTAEVTAEVTTNKRKKKLKTDALLYYSNMNLKHRKTLELQTEQLHTILQLTEREKPTKLENLMIVHSLLSSTAPGAAFTLLELKQIEKAIAFMIKKCQETENPIINKKWHP